MIGFGSYLKDYLEYEGISQSQFAFQLGITQKHMNSILNSKAELSLELMIAISLLSNIDLNFIAKIENRRKMKLDLLKKYESEEGIENFLKKFKVNELNKRNWISFKDYTNTYQKAFDILEFLRVKDFNVVNKLKERILFKENGDKAELLSLWVSRCDRLAEKQDVKEYYRENIDKVIKLINQYIFANKNISKEQLQAILNKNGFYFVIENPLKTTKARGSFKIYKNHPAIYLSRSYKRLDGIVYSLYHELGHAKSDYNQAKSKIIIVGSNIQEERSDRFAYTSMISNKIFTDIIKGNIEENRLLDISKKEQIPMCYITSQLAKESIISYRDDLYQKYIVRV